MAVLAAQFGAQVANAFNAVLPSDWMGTIGLLGVAGLVYLLAIILLGGVR